MAHPSQREVPAAAAVAQDQPLGHAAGRKPGSAADEVNSVIGVSRFYELADN